MTEAAVQIRQTLRFIRASGELAQIEWKDSLACLLPSAQETTLSLTEEQRQQLRKACDRLFAACQMLLQMLDAKCRPLLSEELDPALLPQILELIQWLNALSLIQEQAPMQKSGLSQLLESPYQLSELSRQLLKFWKSRCPESLLPSTSADAPVRQLETLQQRDAQRRREAALQETKLLAQNYQALLKKEADRQLGLLQEELEKQAAEYLRQMKLITDPPQLDILERKIQMLLDPQLLAAERKKLEEIVKASVKQYELQLAAHIQKRFPILNGRCMENTRCRELSYPTPALPQHVLSR